MNVQVRPGNLDRVLTHLFSTLQWDLDKPVRRKASHEGVNSRGAPPSEAGPDSAQPHFTSRPQVGRARDRNQRMNERAEKSFGADVMGATAKAGATAGARAAAVAQEANELPREKPKLSQDGRLPPRQSVRFVAQDGSHR